MPDFPSDIIALFFQFSHPSTYSVLLRLNHQWYKIGLKLREMRAQQVLVHYSKPIPGYNENHQYSCLPNGDLHGPAKIPSHYISTSSIGPHRHVATMRELQYSFGKLHGRQVHKFLSGEIQLEKHYEKGLLHGPMTIYDDSFCLRKEGRYIRDKVHGLHKIYHENGQLAEEHRYKRGLTHGCQRAYYDTGQLRRESHYRLQQIHGWFRSWYKNGQVSAKTLYIKGVPKEERRWNEQGKLIYNKSDLKSE